MITKLFGNKTMIVFLVFVGILVIGEVLIFVIIGNGISRVVASQAPMMAAAQNQEEQQKAKTLETFATIVYWLADMAFLSLHTNNRIKIILFKVNKAFENALSRIGIYLSCVILLIMLFSLPILDQVSLPIRIIISIILADPIVRLRRTSLIAVLIAVNPKLKDAINRRYESRTKEEK